MRREIEGTGCPRCGRIVPAAISNFGSPWKLYREHQIEQRKKMLSRKAWKIAPADLCDGVRQQTERELQQFQDGSWVAEYMQTIREFEQLASIAHAGAFSFGTSGMETPALTAFAVQLQIQKLKEELEAAGEAP